MASSELDMKKYFLCCYCKLIVQNPCEKDCCGSLVCNDCTKIYLELNNYCGTCKKKYNFRKNHFAKRLLNNGELKCIFECGFSTNYEKIRSHLLVCQKRIFYCNECDFQGLKLEYKLHFIENHVDVFFEMVEYNSLNNKAMINKKKELQDELHPEFLSRVNKESKTHQYKKFKRREKDN